MISELQPARGFDKLLETAFAIAKDLKTDKMGTPKHLLRIVILLDEAGGEFYPAGVPMPVWRASLRLVAALAYVGRLLGYDARHAPPASSMLPLVSALWLLDSALGARVAIREDLPGRFAGMTRWRDPTADFLKGTGTALSPGLPMMAAQAVFTVLGTRGGTVGKVGAVGTTALGAGATIGVLGEPITYRVLSPTTFDPPKAAIVSASVILSPLMAGLGARRLLTLKDRR